jgi:restriction endonuclease Mrr
MFVLVVAGVPLLVGFALILLIARYSPNVPRVEPLVPGQKLDDRPEITADEFVDLVTDLLSALGLETVFSSAGTGGVVDVTARDPKPLSGGRILLHATPVLGGKVDAADVLSFAEGVRGDMGALKGIFIALAGFTEEAHAGIRSSPAPVDLIDGAGLLELVREHLPDRAEVLETYRGFDRFARRHTRAGRERDAT